MTTSSPLSVKPILGSTREGRFGDKPAHWILGEARSLPGLEVELRKAFHKLEAPTP